MVLTESELEYIKSVLNREPNSLEYGMLDVMFSEHCSYKSSRPILKLFPTDSDDVIIGPGDDAGIVSITDELALAVGIESHNHPSAIEPYGGAGTGIGGILRDIISMGAMPICLLDSIRFGKLTDQKSRYLFEHVVKGISDYGNRVGIPTVGGETEFDNKYKQNPLVNVMCVGLLKKKDLVKSIAPNIDDVFLLMGGRTGRDGISGVTFASEELTSKSEIEDRPAVQIADPFTKKKVLEASLEILQEINVTGVKDLGGGGLTCCISELVDKCNNGAEIELSNILLREKGMTPYEIMLSESQERMIFVINPDDIDKAIQICEKHDIPVSIIGKVTNTENLRVKDKEIIADIPTSILADPPTINRIGKPVNKVKEPIKVIHPNAEESLLKLLSSENIANKEWIYKQYDHEVQIRTIVNPGDDAAVLKIDENTSIAVNTDCNSLHTQLNPYNGGASSVAETIRNVVSMGARPLCIVDCLNFGNPENEEIFWQFEECVKGMSDLAKKFNLPVISGNVSFYNETEGESVSPSPVVGTIGSMKIDNIRTMEFKNEGDVIIIFGNTYNELEGSEYHRTIHNIVQGNGPKINMESELKSCNCILDLIENDENNNITAIHDCSSGGLGISISEMCIKSNLGAHINLSNMSDNCENIEKLFSETNGRYIISVKKEKINEITENINIPYYIIGEVKGTSLNIDDLINISIEKLKANYENVIEKFMT